MADCGKLKADHDACPSLPFPSDRCDMSTRTFIAALIKRWLEELMGVILMVIGLGMVPEIAGVGKLPQIARTRMANASVRADQKDKDCTSGKAMQQSSADGPSQPADVQLPCKAIPHVESNVQDVSVPDKIGSEKLPSDTTLPRKDSRAPLLPAAALHRKVSRAALDMVSEEDPTPKLCLPMACFEMPKAPEMPMRSLSRSTTKVSFHESVDWVFIDTTENDSSPEMKSLPLRNEDDSDGDWPPTPLPPVIRGIFQASLEEQHDQGLQTDAATPKSNSSFPVLFSESQAHSADDPVTPKAHCTFRQTFDEPSTPDPVTPRSRSLPAFSALTFQCSEESTLGFGV